MTRHRYWVVLLMFLSVFINYMDRVNFNVAIPKIQSDLGFNLDQIGQISFAWAIVYAVFNFPGGWLADRIGLRWALPLLLGWWSAFTIATPFARGLGAWFAVRGLMGAGEAPIWPVNAKVANTWAAPGERSTLYTWAGSGQFAAPALMTMVAGWIVASPMLGWQWSFVIFGAVGFLIVPLWIWIVRDRPAQDARVNAEELAFIGNRAAHDEKPDWPGIRDVVFSRTGIGMLLVYLTFGYVLFTFLNWMPTYMHDQFGMSILKGSAWSTVGALMGLLGFLISGPFNDRLVRRFDRLTARRIGAAAPMALGAVAIAFSVPAATAGQAGATAILIGFAMLLMNMTVGAWAVNVIDISPNQASTGFVYGIYNGVLNVMGAFSSIIITRIATAYHFNVAFGSAIVFMLVFVLGIFIVDRKSYERLVAKAHAVRSAT